MTQPFNPAAEPASSFASFTDATEFLERCCRRFGVRHLSYWSVSLEDGLPDQVTWIATYDPAYMSHYMGRYTPVGDPAFEAANAGAGVIDWAEFSKDDKTAQAMHAAAAKHGIGKHGLSLPIKAGDSRLVLFSVNCDCSDAQWPAEKARALVIIGPFAHYFHGRARYLVESRQFKCPLPSA
jgi:autoinducer binding domain-containing protein